MIKSVKMIPISSRSFRTECKLSAQKTRPSFKHSRRPPKMHFCKKLQASCLIKTTNHRCICQVMLDLPLTTRISLITLHPIQQLKLQMNLAKTARPMLIIRLTTKKNRRQKGEVIIMTTIIIRAIILAGFSMWVLNRDSNQIILTTQIMRPPKLLECIKIYPLCLPKARKFSSVPPKVQHGKNVPQLALPYQPFQTKSIIRSKNLKLLSKIKSFKKLQ